MIDDDYKAIDELADKIREMKEAKQRMLNLYQIKPIAIEGNKFYAVIVHPKAFRQMKMFFHEKKIGNIAYRKQRRWLGEVI